ncbi:MAG: PulJ/GspJ family protein [Puniceicoccales bacterium]
MMTLNAQRCAFSLLEVLIAMAVIAVVSGPMIRLLIASDELRAMQEQSANLQTHTAAQAQAVVHGFDPARTAYPLAEVAEPTLQPVPLGDGRTERAGAVVVVPWTASTTDGNLPALGFIIETRTADRPPEQ